VGVLGGLILEEVGNSCYGCCEVSKKGLLSSSEGLFTTGSMTFSWIKSAVMFHCWEAVVVTEIAGAGDNLGLTSVGEVRAGVCGIIEMTGGPGCIGRQVKPEGESGGRR